MGIVLKNVNITGGKLSADFQNKKTGWIRNPDWLPLPEITNTDDIIIGLWAIFQDDENVAAVQVSGDNGFFEVNWGDDSGWFTYPNGTAIYTYDYNNIHLHTSNLPYKQAVIQIRPQSSSSLTSYLSTPTFSVSSNQSARWTYKFLEIKLSMPSATSIQISGVTRRHPYLEHVEVHNIGSVTFMTAFCRTHDNLKKISMFASTSNVVSMSESFRDNISLLELPMMDTSNVTSMFATFRACWSITTVPPYDTQNVSNFSFCFVDCRALKYLPPLNIQSATNIQGMFVDAQNLTKVEFINSHLASLTLVNAAFARCLSLTEIPFINTTNVSNFQDMFVDCVSLLEVPNLNLVNATTCNFMFQSNRSLRKLPDFNTQNQTTFPTGTNFIPNGFNLTWIETKFRNSVNISQCQLGTLAVVYIFTNLFDRTSLPAANINITGNPAARSPANGGLSTSDRNIALNKNWTITG
jgi:hypothetical protein